MKQQIQRYFYLLFTTIYYLLLYTMNKLQYSDNT